MASTILIRRDTSAHWTYYNPVLHDGELGLETDTGNMKVGNGSSAWISLEYFNSALTLIGTTLASNVINSSLTEVGTITSGTWSGLFGSVSGANLTNITAANISSGTAGINITGTAPAGSLTGTTLSSNVVNSSLTEVGTIGTGTWHGTIIGVAYGGTGLATLTANNVILGNGTSTPDFVAPGTSGNVLTSNGTTWISSTPTIYNPADQTITSAGNLTLTHGLGAIPLNVRCFLVCETAENNYSVGDIVDLNNTSSNAGATNIGMAIVVTSTEIYIRFCSNSSVFAIPNKTSGTISTLTNTHWKLRIYARAAI